MTLSETLGA